MFLNINTKNVTIKQVETSVAESTKFYKYEATVIRS